MTVTIDIEQVRAAEAGVRAAHDRDLAHAHELIGDRTHAVVDEIARLSVGVPSWALGTGGTRFGRFPGGGEPRTVDEKLDDVAALNVLTGANRTISLHVPWDQPSDPPALKAWYKRRCAHYIYQPSGAVSCIDA
jgi:L-rhamnose isomerase/sugar isomerase